MSIKPMPIIYPKPDKSDCIGASDLLKFIKIETKSGIKPLFALAI
jgi:hypothetical protein